MLTILKAYPYLFANLLSFSALLCAARLLLTPAQWRTMLLSGLANVPAFGLLIYLEEEYWRPARVGGWILGLEDALCSFVVAAMAWFIVALFFRDRILFEMKGTKVFRRYLLVAGLSMAAFLMAFFIGLSGMTALIVACAGVALFLLATQRPLWPLALLGLFAFPAFWLSLVKVDFWLWPNFVSQWSPQPPWGLRFLGIPLGEIVWSSVFGAYWPLFTTYIFNGRTRRGSSVPLGFIGDPPSSKRGNLSSDSSR